MQPDIESIIFNAIGYPVRLDSAGLTTFGTISGIFIAKNQDYIYEIREDSVLFEPSPFRLDAKMKCKMGTPCGDVCIPRGAKCRKGMMTPSAKAKVGFTKAALAAGVVAAAGAGAIAASRNKTPLTQETTAPSVPVTTPKKSLARRVANEYVGQTVHGGAILGGTLTGLAGGIKGGPDAAYLGGASGGAAGFLAGGKAKKAIINKLGGGIDNPLGKAAIATAAAGTVAGGAYVGGTQYLMWQKRKNAPHSQDVYKEMSEIAEEKGGSARSGDEYLENVAEAKKRIENRKRKEKESKMQKQERKRRKSDFPNLVNSPYNRRTK